MGATPVGSTTMPPPVLAAGLTAPTPGSQPDPRLRAGGSGDEPLRWARCPDDGLLHLPTRTLDWLAKDPRTRRLVHSVWDKLTELERDGHDPGALDALRSVLTHHQPTSAGRCRTCPRMTGRRRPFPCIVWHQIRIQLLGSFASSGVALPSHPYDGDQICPECHPARHTR